MIYSTFYQTLMYISWSTLLAADMASLCESSEIQSDCFSFTWIMTHSVMGVSNDVES